MMVLRSPLAYALALILLPGAAMAQGLEHRLPMTAKPPGLASPRPVDPAHPIPPDDRRTGVIRPPPMVSRMPVIHPKTPSRMRVIKPPGSPGGNPNLVPR